MEKYTYPRVKVMCLFNKNGKTLAAQCVDSRFEDGVFYRVLGGSLEMNETIEEGMRREIQEELDSEIENLKFIQVIENRFTYQGIPGHEIIFMYSGDLVRKELYEVEEFEVIDNPHVPESYTFTVKWISFDDVLSGKKTLFPDAKSYLL